MATSRRRGPEADPTAGRRADARRNIAAILDAAVSCLASDPDASINDIARAAGVGRVTLYGHFTSRTELVDKAFAHVVDQAEQALAAVDVTGDPRDALARLVGATWQIVDRLRALLVAAQHELPPRRIRTLHDRPMRRVRTLIERGREEGAFRTDQPIEWLVATFYAVLHGAAEEVTAGRVPDPDAAGLITATLLSAYSPPSAG